MEATKTYQIWMSEGEYWYFSEFDSEQEVADFIASGGCPNNFFVTRLQVMRVDLRDYYPPAKTEG